MKIQTAFLYAIVVTSLTFAQTLAQDWQRKAVEAYPEIGTKGSPLNTKFITLMNERKRSNPDFFMNPQWPLLLAKEAATANQTSQSIIPLKPSVPSEPLTVSPTLSPTKNAPAPLQLNRDDSFSLRPEFERLGLKPLTQGMTECTVFSTLGVVEFEYAYAGSSIRFSSEFAKWASTKLTGRRDGVYPHKSVVQGITEYGLCREELMPSNTAAIHQPSKAAIQDASTRRNVKFHWIQDHAGKAWGFSDQEIQAICKSIADKHPVACGTRWPDVASGTNWQKKIDSASFQQTYTFDAKNYPVGMVPKGGGVLGHAVVLVGYEKGKQWEGGGRFEFRNSAGEAWGNAGYAWLTFGFLKKHGVRACSIHAVAPKGQLPAAAP